MLYAECLFFLSVFFNFLSGEKKGRYVLKIYRLKIYRPKTKIYRTKITYNIDMQNEYIFLKRASTRFRFYEKVLKKRRGLGPGLGEAIIFF